MRVVKLSFKLDGESKNVFQIHGTDGKGKCVLRRRLSRERLKEFLSNLSPCLIGIEACTGSHYWARLFIKMGHTVKMMAPQFVKPYIKSNKNDRNDARGIAKEEDLHLKILIFQI
jgi:transposase